MRRQYVGGLARQRALGPSYPGNVVRLKFRVALLLLGGLAAYFLYVQFGQSLSAPLGTPLVNTKKLYPLEDGRTWEFVEHSSSFGESKRKYVVIKNRNEWIIDEAGRGILNAMPMHYKISAKGLESTSGFLGAQKTRFEPAFLELPNVIELGKAWSWRGVLSQGPNVEIRSTYQREESVTVPAGTFLAIKIVRNISADLSYTHWYARDVGPVKVLSERPMFSSTMELVSYAAVEE